MPLEDAAGSARELSERAFALWQNLATAYDDIERALQAPESVPLAALATQIVSLESDLRPLVARLAAIRSEPGNAGAELHALWQETDRVVETLARRQPTLVRAALAARDETATRLARARDERRGRAHYGNVPAGAPRFTSQRA